MAIVKYLKAKDERCIGCNTCMAVCSRTFFKEENPEKSSIQVETQGEKSYHLVVCNQKCQLCVSECPALAISVNKLGVVMIDKKACIGCLACVAVCPIGAMMHADSNPNPHKCVACGACARECPAEALEIVQEEV